MSLITGFWPTCGFRQGLLLGSVIVLSACAILTMFLALTGSPSLGLDPDYSARKEADGILYFVLDSQLNEDSGLPVAIQKRLQQLAEAQQADGTWTQGWNIESPADTAFIVKSLWFARELSENVLLRSLLDPLILKSGEALIHGGVHTANHRWLVSAVLSALYSTYGDARYKDRAEQWLQEKIDIDEDGQYSERSTGIYGPLVDTDLILIARFLNRPELMTIVRKHLNVALHFFREPYEVETLASRRQDQWRQETAFKYLIPLSVLGHQDSSSDLLNAARWIFSRMTEGESKSPHWRAWRKVWPEDFEMIDASNTAIPESYNKLFSSSRTVRIRNDRWDITAYGGQDKDWPVGSGIASNPTILNLRTTDGSLIVESIRIASGLFGTGALTPEVVELNSDELVLRGSQSVGYYQPLDSSLAEPNRLEFDGRFYNPMSFSDREISNLKSLEWSLSLSNWRGSKLNLNLSVEGESSVWFSLEVCFRNSTGELQGVAGVVTEPNTFVPEEKSFVFRSNNEARTLLHFGWSGFELATHSKYRVFGSEQFKQHRGELPRTGKCVYLHEYTPFEQGLVISLEE